MSAGAWWDRVTLGPRRRRRRMLRRLTELDRLDAHAAAAGPHPWRTSTSTVNAVPSPPSRARLTVLPVVATVVLTAGLLWVRTAAGDRIDQFAEVIALDGGRPPLPADAAANRLVPVPAPPAGTDGYELMLTNGASVAAYDPCRPLHLVVNLEAAPPTAAAVLDDAIAMVGPAAGLRIVVDGATDEVAQDSRPTIDRARYGNRWSPALVAWTTPQRVAHLEGDTVGVGGSMAVTDSAGRLHNVTGIVHLDGPDLTSITAQRDGHALAVAVVAHELSHLLGLDHTDDPGQLMHTENTGRTTLGEGDRRGLAALAAVPCTREL